MAINFSVTYASGNTLAITLQRQSDNYEWREAATQGWEALGTSSFDNRKISLNAGNNDKLGYYSGVSSGTFGNAGRVIVRVHDDAHVNNYSLTTGGMWVWNSEEVIPLRPDSTDRQLTVGTDGAADSNLTKVSGVPVSLADIAGYDSYYAGIKYIHDLTQDEYAVTWYKNSSTVGSGQITNPAISVRKTTDGSYLFIDKKMDYIGADGDLRYNEVTDIAASGEPYMVYVSGTIDSQVRIWKNPVGIDFV